MNKSVAVVSGGMDSVTLLYDMLDKGYEPHVLSFDYGQRHKKELDFAIWHSAKNKLQHDIIDLTGITHLISNSALTAHSTCKHPNEAACDAEGGCDTIEVPDGHYAEESMKATVVPNRNMIMISIAAAVAVNEKAQLLGIGVHAGDHFIYPDCRPLFVHTMEAAIQTGNDGFIHEDFGIYAPWLHITKTEIANHGNALGIKWRDTWSCYVGGERHCGRCGTCVERAESLAGSDLGIDPTEYADPDFWRTQVGK